jgi:hypothetical protein
MVLWLRWAFGKVWRRVVSPVILSFIVFNSEELFRVLVRSSVDLINEIKASFLVSKIRLKGSSTYSGKVPNRLSLKTLNSLKFFQRGKDLTAAELNIHIYRYL